MQEEFAKKNMASGCDQDPNYSPSLDKDVSEELKLQQVSKKISMNAFNNIRKAILIEPKKCKPQTLKEQKTKFWIKYKNDFSRGMKVPKISKPKIGSMIKDTIKIYKNDKEEKQKLENKVEE